MAFPFTGRIEVGWLFVAEMTYVFYLVLKLKEGLPRLLALLPLLPLSLLVVWRAPTAFERTVYCSFFLWMLMFKLVALAWGKGLAADSYALSSFPRFVYACASAVHLPLDPQFVKEADSVKRRCESEATSSSGRKKSGASAGTGKQRSQSDGVQNEGPVEVETITTSSILMLQTMATSKALHMVILRSLFYYIITTSLLRMVLTSWTDLVSEFVLDLMLGVFTYFWCLLFLEVVVVLPASIVGTELQPLFDMPFLADSLEDFWSRRWNLLVINLLRVSVYEPMLRILGRGKKPSIVDRAISAVATFLVSGLMHELALFCASRSRPSWEMTTFFVLNGAGTIVERSVKAQYRILVPRSLRRACTLIFVYFLAHWFLFPPLKRNGLLEGMADLRVSIDRIETMILLQ